MVIQITAQAKRIIDRAASNTQGATVVVIHRRGPEADVSRGPDGSTKWRIDRPHPLAAQIATYENIAQLENVVSVDGINVWLALLPRNEEAGFIVSARGSTLHVAAIDV
jgi:hypothetical protein